MSWSRFAKILRTRPLDRETKLMLIDLLAGMDDPKFEKEIFTFVFAWEEAEAQTQKTLIEGIKNISKEYTQTKENLDLKNQKTALSIADDLNREQRIKDLKASIQNL